MKVLQMLVCLYNVIIEVVHKIAKVDYNQRNTKNSLSYSLESII